MEEPCIPNVPDLAKGTPRRSYEPTGQLEGAIKQINDAEIISQRIIDQQAAGDGPRESKNL